MRVAVLASGVGTILESLVDHGVVPALVVADRPALALERARDAGLVSTLVDRRSYGWRDSFDREAFSDAVADVLEAAKVELVVLAGFMTILAGSMLARFPARVVNTHPSLLPSFPGHDAVAQALSAGVRVSGTTVHVVVEQVDAGPILEQEPVRVRRGDSIETLHERIKHAERELYPRVVRAIVRAGVGGDRWWEDARVQRAIDEEVRPWRER
ncbi:phosphoribosylglycinamide formyltransferase [Acidimicrobium ferrooxidans DSM 10331]|uniref:Phosphoribosylglycinamide formyltransferase n=1 Tax=Acidimicrobium ferrooxidans (strain DSM 10331 / JCM 15462 / NBRC 103882 / ICP) TaxID=525909 RepID=C7M2P5_ACIFD|nr:phosphoribosylglycinamide formyltransferase [Acidimicrobium ferrooxidans]ACU53289.1 phosphoribosylglycinamide formyltransferase [Acidimicrobium ferrooxidans DSM 10331]